MPWLYIQKWHDFRLYRDERKTVFSYKNILHTHTHTQIRWDLLYPLTEIHLYFSPPVHAPFQIMGSLVLPLLRYVVTGSVWCVLGFPCRHCSPWVSNLCNESSICCPNSRLRDQPICACGHYGLPHLNARAARVVGCFLSLSLTHTHTPHFGNFAPPLLHWSWATCSFFTPVSSLTRILCPVQLGIVVLNSFCFLVMCDSSSRSGPFILLQTVLVTGWAAFINCSPTHGHWYLPFLCHLFWQII